MLVVASGHGDTKTRRLKVLRASVPLWLVVSLGLLSACAQTTPSQPVTAPSRPPHRHHLEHAWRPRRSAAPGRRPRSRAADERATPRDYVLLLQEFVNRGDVPWLDVTGVDTLHQPGPRRVGQCDPRRHSRSRTRGRSTCRVNGNREPLWPPPCASAATALFVVSTHLENRLGWLRGLFGDRARGRQADALLQALPHGPRHCGRRLQHDAGPERARVARPLGSVSRYTGRTRADVSRSARARSSVLRSAGWMACDAAGDP